MKTIVLIIASLGYQPVEYSGTKKAIEEAGFKVVTASDVLGTAKASAGDKTATVDVQVDDIKPEQYDGVFLIGGPGALDCLDNESVQNKMKQVAQAGKAFGAICISPRILAKAGLLSGKKATGWDEDNKLAGIFSANGVLYTKQDVVTDDNIVTASGPLAAIKFGQAIAALFK